MKLSPLTKQLITEAFLKTAIRAPSQLNLPPGAMRFALEQLCRAIPKNPDVQIRRLRIAGLRAEELKPQRQATQLIFHIHGGAFFLGSLNTHRAFLTQVAARTQMQVLHLDYPLSPEHPHPEALDALFDAYCLLLDQGVQAKDIILKILDHNRNVLSQPAFSVNVTALADFSINLTVRWWVNTTETTTSASISEIQELVVTAFDEKGISIPYPVQEVKVYRGDQSEPINEPTT